MEEQKNLAAWECLDQALFTSSHVKAKDIEKGSTLWDNVYPVSEEETNRMAALVDEARQKADDPTEPAFVERVNDLREVIIYSRKKHRTWKFSLIVGSIIAACIFWYFGNQDKATAQRFAKDVTIVENWKKMDTTITYQSIKISDGTNGNAPDYNSKLNSANQYKYYTLYKLKSSIEYNAEESQRYQNMADTASTSDKKESRLKTAKKYKEKAEKKRAEFDEIVKYGFDDVKKMALEETQGTVDHINNSANKKVAWMIYLIILIPLYIITGYPKGYMISCHRRQHGFMEKLRKWGFVVASFFFGAGLLMQLLPDDIVEYQYASGRTETRREENAANMPILVMKFVLMAIGVLIFCFISVLIMTIETFTGLKRNFKWGEMMAKAQKKVPVEA